MNHEKHEKHEKILLKEECYEIQGAIFEVCREMGCGFLKAVKAIAPEHKAQVINYLKATGMKLGLLVNFGAYPKALITRLAL